MGFGAKAERIENLQQRVTDLTGQLAVERAVGPLTEEVRAEITRFRDEGQLEVDANSLAMVQVIENEKHRLTDEKAKILLDTKYAELADKYRGAEGPGITQRFDAQYDQDGTYDHLRQEAQEAVESEIGEGLLAQNKAEVMAQLNTPESRQKVTNDLRPKIANSTELQNFRRTTQAELEEAWAEEVRTEEKAKIEAEEIAREGGFRETYGAAYRNSAEMATYREKIRSGLEKDWDDATVEQVNEAVKDEELAELLNKKARLTKEKLARETRAAELLRDFEVSGIDVAAIDVNSNVVIYLGEIKKETVKVDNGRDPYAYGGLRQKEVIQTVLACARKLVLQAHGDGRFKVRSDSLKTSNSVWEQSLAIADGTVIAIGNLLSDSGQNTLDPRISADAHFHYDDDTTTPATFAEMAVPVANIEIDGVSARKVDVVKPV